MDDLRGNGLEVQQSQVRETKLVHKIKGYTPLKQDSPRSADGQQQHPGLQLVHDANRRGDNRDPKRQMERFIEQEQEQQHGDSKLSKPGNRLEPKEPKKPNPEIIINEDGFDFQDTGDSSSSSSSASDHKGFGDSGGVKRGSGYGTDWPTTPPLTDSPAEQPSTLGGAAGGCLYMLKVVLQQNGWVEEAGMLPQVIGLCHVTHSTCAHIRKHVFVLDPRHSCNAGMLWS